MQARLVGSIAEIAAGDWNALSIAGSPFLRHEFLLALEKEKCVGRSSGWLPAHLVIESDSGMLLGAIPLYLKSHSWGEFVFDWSWARAYTQAGLNYYPKLTSMTPFTPATSPRLLIAPGADATRVRAALLQALTGFARDQGASSAHLLFISDEDRAALDASEFLWRKDCQFHWHNRGYKTFDEFLATFRADKRKKAHRERRRIAEAGIEFLTLGGAEISASLWNTVFGFSAATFHAHGHEHYLTANFFRTVAAALPDSIMVKLAQIEARPIAAAIFFRSADTLYGRYWGSGEDFHSLHFETCYYQGIDYCIANGIARFEPGTQGEHKVPRGFEPATTWSAHWIADPRFRRAIGSYLDEERAAVDQYTSGLWEHVPFRRDQMHEQIEVKPENE
jgi:predicted N-acyltransferase